MRLNEFNTDGPDLISSLRDTCTQYLDATQKAGHGNLLFRGDNYKADDWYSAKTRENRLPLANSVNLQRIADGWLQLKGFRALRHNSIFCINNQRWAETFGRLYAIFPEDGFDFTWSPLIKDFNNHNIGAQYPLEIKRMDDGERHSYKPEIQLANEFVEKNGFTNTNLANAIFSRKEVLIRGNYYAVKWDEAMRDILFRAFPWLANDDPEDDI